MIENRPGLNILAHLVLIAGIVIVALPVWVAFVASTRGATDFMSGTIPMWPGPYLIENYSRMLDSCVFDLGYVLGAEGRSFDSRWL